MNVTCLFEQSGTFKHAFERAGHNAIDIDISDKFGETNMICDIFDQLDGYIENYDTIMNSIMHSMCESKVTGYNITLKNTKTNRNKRWIIKSYEITEKEIVIKLPDETVKRYQRNEWTIVHTSIHYF